jgi:hypothetical protein
MALVVLVAAAAIATAAPADSARRPPRTAQHALLQDILRGFPETRLTGRVGAPARDWGERRHRSFLQSTWLYFTLRPRDEVDHVRQFWQASVAEGLLAGISKSRGWRPVTGATFFVVLPDGTRRFESASVIGGSSGGIDHATEAEAEQALRESAASVGATLAGVRFPRPLGRLAIEAVVVTEHPERFTDRYLLNVGRIAQPVARRAEGVFIEVRTPDGRWVAARGGSGRTSSGVSTINSDYR